MCNIGECTNFSHLRHETDQITKLEGKVLEIKGTVTEIQRFSLKDGPGIRTTVFLKGCNMACRWCHNPETLSRAPQLMRYPGHCIACGMCIKVCENDAMTIMDGELLFSREKCTDCGKCSNECFSGTLKLAGMEITVDDVMKEVLQDIDYYKNSGGGLTISGGEVICQPEFTKALLEAAKNEGISTAIETNMHAEWSVYENLLPLLDLVMLDIKLSCDEAHLQWTGVGNKLLLENTRKLAETGTPLVIRTPVIPGVNDTEEEIGRIAEIVK